MIQRQPGGRATSLLACASMVLLAGCTTWQPVTESPGRLITEERPASVRITTSDGAEVTLKDPRIVNDSLVGDASGAAPRTPPRVCLACGDIRAVEVERFSTGRTIALAATIAAVSFGWASLAGDSEGGSSESPGPLPKAQALWGGIRLLLGPGR